MSTQNTTPNTEQPIVNKPNGHGAATEVKTPPQPPEQPAVGKPNGKPEEKVTEVKVTLREREQALVVHEALVKLLGLAFDVQNDDDGIENESKFGRMLLFDCLKDGIKAKICAKYINAWENEITKATKLPEKYNRETAETHLLTLGPVPRRMRERAVKAAQLKERLK